MRLIPFLACLLCIGACAPASEIAGAPNCGAPVRTGDVTVVEAETVYAEGGIDAVMVYAQEQVGPFTLGSNQTLRADDFPRRGGDRKWIDSQKAAAKLGCNLLIVVDSKLMDTGYGRSRHYLLLAGRTDS